MDDELAPTLNRLAQLSIKLTEVSDELAKPINELDEYLKSLNLGLSCFITISDQGSTTKLRLGYTKLDRWGLVLSKTEKDVTEDWLYNNAPRWLRLRGVRFLPVLFDALVKTSEATIKRVEEKTNTARAIVAIITEEGGR